jgi:hypothetical protein
MFPGRTQQLHGTRPRLSKVERSQSSHSGKWMDRLRADKED